MSKHENFDLSLNDAKVAILGLGYVGLPLALELSKYSDVTGFDVNAARIESLRGGEDTNAEMGGDVLSASTCVFTSDIEDITECNVYIVTVPTPIDENNQPDLGALRKASEALGGLLKAGDVAVYESTVYPGVTEEVCGPILEEVSGLKSGEDFFLGYSPERINPGDTVNTLATMTKVVAGQNEPVADFLVALYGQVNDGNIFKAKDIKTAEAAKAIENAQRDINVAFINEVTMVLNKLDVSVYDVLEAAKTKWNFLPFTPGLVGGHCIGVDPYYLAKCALDHGHNPEMILAGRSINDGMGAYFASQISAGIKDGGKVLVLGFTFKEDINDIRNTKVIDVVRSLEGLGHDVDVCDHYASPDEADHEYGVPLVNMLPADGEYDAVVLAVGHKEYVELAPAQIEAMLKDSHGLVYDIKSVWRGKQFSENIRYKCL